MLMFLLQLQCNVTVTVPLVVWEPDAPAAAVVCRALWSRGVNAANVDSKMVVDFCTESENSRCGSCKLAWK